MASEILCGAPDPPLVLIGRSVHPRVLPIHIEQVIRRILLPRLAMGKPMSMFEVYAAVCAMGELEFEPEAALYREHPRIKEIAGACQYLHFSGQLAGREAEKAVLLAHGE